MPADGVAVKLRVLWTYEFNSHEWPTSRLGYFLPNDHTGWF